MMGTDNYGVSLYTITLPLPPVTFTSFDGWVFIFHPDFPDQMMFAGQKGCPGTSCHAEVTKLLTFLKYTFIDLLIALCVYR